MTNGFMIGAIAGMIAGAVLVENKNSIKKTIDKGICSVKSSVQDMQEMQGSN